VLDYPCTTGLPVDVIDAAAGTLRSDPRTLQFLRVRIADLETRLVDITSNNRDVFEGLQEVAGHGADRSACDPRQNEPKRCGGPDDTGAPCSAARRSQCLAGLATMARRTTRSMTPARSPPCDIYFGAATLQRKISRSGTTLPPPIHRPK